MGVYEDAFGKKKKPKLHKVRVGGSTVNLIKPPKTRKPKVKRVGFLESFKKEYESPEKVKHRKGTKRMFKKTLKKAWRKII